MLFVRLVVTMLACVCLLSGCFSGGGSGRLVEFYTLEYAPPASTGPGTDKIVKIDRFSAVRSYDNTAMQYVPAAYKIVAYNYHKWRTTPGDMVTDYLLRDFRHSGLFRAVFSYRQPEFARFVVEGGVEDFVETKEANGWSAVLGLQVTLLDMTQSEVTEKVMFQKRYRVVQPIDGESPVIFAEGLSAAMARISAQIIGDVSSAVKERGEQGP
jgi:cholesterol transport system auxiliary component